MNEDDKLEALQNIIYSLYWLAVELIKNEG